MKYPVIYVKNLMGVHKHSSVSYALHLRIVSDEAEDEQRAAYQRKVLTQMYHMVENQLSWHSRRSWKMTAICSCCSPLIWISGC